MSSPDRSFGWRVWAVVAVGVLMVATVCYPVTYGSRAGDRSTVASSFDATQFAPFAVPLGNDAAPRDPGAPTYGGRTLDWPQFDVSAHLDSTGALLVRERQHIRFNGDWNGGERIFDVRFGQRFEFHSIQRVDQRTGALVPLTAEAIDQIDGYTWADSRTLRWRSRLPSDPPFDNTHLTYILEYRYLDILRPEDGSFVLDPEFAFRNREGDIERFSLALTLDPGWQAPPSFAGTWTDGPFAPGVSFVVNTNLEWRGAGRPSNVLYGADPTFAMACVAALALALLLLFGRLLQREQALGRFAQLPASAIDDAWLQEHVFSLPPEVVGTAWDDQVGAAEVSATLARMVSEGKLVTKVETSGKWIFTRHNLHLELKADRDRLPPHERALIDGFFPLGSRQTSTDDVRTRYASTGFDPASLIRGHLQRQLDAVTSDGGIEPTERRWPVTLGLLAVGIALIVLAARERLSDVLILMAGVGAGLMICLAGLSQALVWRKRVLRAGVHLLRVLIPLAALPAALWWLSARAQTPASTIVFVALTVFGIAYGKLMLDAARSPHTRERMLMRQRLLAARQYFRRELTKPDPQIEQAWYPYLLALGLNRQVTQWFKAFGGATDAASHAVHSGGRAVGASAGLSGLAGDDRSWSGFGGGGGFAGAGATVAFGAAVSGFSSGVSAPSSSSSGGGSSSSGGGSGGGGGGGW